MAGYAPAAMRQPDRLLTQDEAASYLRVSPRTLQRWRTEVGIGPPWHRAGRRVLYKQRDLDAWLEQQKRGT
jgi:excisionase family DNA binding protein